MPTEVVFENGQFRVKGSDTSEDLRPTVPEDWAPPKPKKRKPPAAADRGMFDKLGNDIKYEANQLRANPGRSLMRLGQTLGLMESGPPVRTMEDLVRRRADQFRQSPSGRGNAGTSLMLLPLVSMGATIARMGFSGAQKAAGAKRADASAGAVGAFIDSAEEGLYRVLGAKPPSQMTRAEREADQALADLRLNLGLVPKLAKVTGFGRATTKLGKATRGAAAWGLTELASQYLSDNTGGGAVDLINALGQASGVIPKGGAGLPGGIGDRAGSLDMIDSANATLAGNVLVPAGIGAGIGLAGRVFPATVRRIRGGKGIERERAARAKLIESGALEDRGDGTYAPGPNAQPAPAQTLAEARDRVLGRSAGPDPAEVQRRLAETDRQLQQMQGRIGADGQSPDPWGGQAPVGMGVFEDPGTMPSDPWGAAGAGTSVLPVLSGAPAPKALPGAPAPQGLTAPRALLPPATERSPFLAGEEPWPDAAPEVTDVLKHVEDELTDEQRRLILSSPAPVMEQLQEFASTPPLPLDTTKRFDLAAFPTERLSTLYLDGMAGVDGWSATIEALDPATLKSLANPINSPELAERVLALTGKEAEEATKSDILEALRSLSQEGRTALPERMRGGMMVPPENIQVDPARFQFKGGVDAQGQQIGASLANEDRWNPRAEGIIQVWRDPADGKLYVVNGHNRLALAKRLGVPSVLVEEITATNAASARAFGAITNIAQGNGNAFDAARFLREANITSPEQLATAGMSGERSWATQGLALSKLPHDLFQQTVDNPDLLRRAVLVGDSGLDEPKMRSLWRHVLDDRVPDWELRELAQLAKASPEIQGRQGKLPGLEDYLEDEGVKTRLRLVREVQRLLREEKNLFRTVGRKAQALEEAGNTIDQEGALATAADADAALRAFETLKYATGPVGDALTAGVSRISQGQQPRAVARLVVEDMKGAIEAEMAALRRGGGDVAPPASPASSGQADLFGAPAAMSLAEREAANIEIAKRAMAEGGARPPSTPLPDLDPAPAVRPDEALADLQENGLTTGGKAAQAIADELRLRRAQGLSDAKAERAALDAVREASGYDETPFREKAQAGLGEDFERQEAPAGATAQEGAVSPPSRPEPLRVSSAPSQPEFKLPPDLASAQPRYGGASLVFESDLDKAAYILAGDTPARASRQAKRYRDLVEAAGLNPAAVRIHGQAVKNAIKETGLRVFGTKQASELKGELRIAPVEMRVARGDALGRDLAAAEAAMRSGSFNAYVAQLQKTIESVVKQVAGESSYVKLSDVYEEASLPREWGGAGTETAVLDGSYNYIYDIVQINGILEGEPVDIIETAFHESFHRLQFMALSREQLKVLDSADARLKIYLAADQLGYRDISYLEQQAVVFQKYAMARMQGKDPVAEIFKDALGQPDSIQAKVAASIVSAFDAISDYIAKFKNAITGKGFESVRSIYDKAYKGFIASNFVQAGKQKGLLRFGEELAGGSHNDLLDLWTTRTAAWESMGQANARLDAIDEEIRRVKSRANSGGCALP